MKRLPKLEVKVNPRGLKRYRFELKDDKGQVLMTSKYYERELMAVRTATRCIDLMRAPTLTLVNMVE